jgi:hypothetical protein
LDNLPLQIRVLRHGDVWRVQYGDVRSDFATRNAAMASAIDRARRHASDGRLVAVVMDVLTSLYGPAGYIRSVGTRRLGPKLDSWPVDAFKDLLARKDGS